MLRAMHQEEALHLVGVLALEEAHQLEAVGVGAVELHAGHLGLHADGLSEDVHDLRAAEDLGPERTGRAEAHGQHGVALVAQRVPQVVPDAPGLHHAAGTDDDAGLLTAVQLFAALAVLHELHPPETEEVGVLLQFLPHLLAEELGVVAHHLGGVDGQGAVHEHRDAGQLACVAQLVERVQHLLRLAHAEGGDDELALLLHAGMLHMPFQLRHGLGDGGMVPIAVGALADHDVGLRRGCGLRQQTVHVAAHVA